MTPDGSVRLTPTERRILRALEDDLRRGVLAPEPDGPTTGGTTGPTTGPTCRSDSNPPGPAGPARSKAVVLARRGAATVCRPAATCPTTSTS